jgi:hypothetical protein
MTHPGFISPASTKQGNIGQPCPADPIRTPTRMTKETLGQLFPSLLSSVGVKMAMLKSTKGQDRQGRQLRSSSCIWYPQSTTNFQSLATGLVTRLRLVHMVHAYCTMHDAPGKWGCQHVNCQRKHKTQDQEERKIAPCTL